MVANWHVMKNNASLSKHEFVLQQPMNIWETQDGEIEVVGLREVAVDSCEELMECLEAGLSSRALGLLPGA